MEFSLLDTRSRRTYIIFGARNNGLHKGRSSIPLIAVEQHHQIGCIDSKNENRNIIVRTEAAAAGHTAKCRSGKYKSILNRKLSALAGSCEIHG